MPIVAATMAEAFQKTARIDPDAVALRTPGDAITVTWRELATRVRNVAAGLAALGVKRGDTVGIMLTNRPEFSIVDAGAMHLGATPFSIYNTSSPEQMAYVFENAGNRVVITQASFVEVVRASGVELDHIICLDGAPEGCLTLEELEAKGDPDFDFEAAWKAVQPDDLLTLIYTSGTTGPPKGVQLTHANLIATANAAVAVTHAGFGDRITSFLPSAHIADRASAQYFMCGLGVQITCIADPREVAAALPDTKPTIWFAVPRVWEKIKMGVEAKIADEPHDKKRKLAQWAIETGQEKARADLDGRKLPRAFAAKHALAEKLVLHKLRDALGMSELRWAWSGAAAIAPETLHFFMGLGINVVELWGMSEITGAGTLNPVGRAKVGTVGPALPGVEITLAHDGEILVRSKGVMPSYRKDPERTAETIDADGWVHTGDVGLLDEDGYLTIVDRKKELIISSAGKNMSPSNIENTLKVHTPLAAAITVIGDARPYNVALVTLDPDAAAAFAEKLGVSADPEVLAKDDRLVAAIAAGIEIGNAKLSKVEQVKTFQVLPTFWAPGGDELTPTLKLKRKPIAAKYAAEITSLYG